MKIKALLLISAALNAFLAFHYLRSRPAPVIATTPAPVVRAYGPFARTNSAAPQFNWQSVEADDYQIYIANLRAIGCPEETIQDIVIADVSKLFEEKKRMARATLPRFEYWKPAAFNAEHEAAETYHKLTQPIDAERNALLRTLGIEPTEHRFPQSTFDSREFLLDFVPTEKRQKILRLYARFSEQANAMRANVPIERRSAAFHDLQQESDRQVKEILTPEEALHYDLRFSSTANSLRKSLIGFEATESEFVELFKLRRPIDEAQRAELATNDGIPIEKVEAAKVDLDEQIKNFLGESRYNDYTRASDFGFQQLYKFTQEKGHPTSVAVNAFEIQRAALGKAYELRQGNLDKNTLDRTLSAIRDETETALQSMLGSEHWNDFQKTFGLSRLNDISRRD